MYYQVNFTMSIKQPGFPRISLHNKHTATYKSQKDCDIYCTGKCGALPRLSKQMVQQELKEQMEKAPIENGLTASMCERKIFCQALWQCFSACSINLSQY